MVNKKPAFAGFLVLVLLTRFLFSRYQWMIIALTITPPKSPIPDHYFQHQSEPSRLFASRQTTDFLLMAV